MTGMLDVVIREAVEADAEAACRVLRRSITECCIADHCNDQELLNSWLRNKTPENVIAWITHDSNITRVAVTGNRIVGFAMLQKSGYLALNYILPEVLFQGVGRALLQALESAAVELRLHELTLESTRTAHDFYLRNGFEVSGASETGSGMESWLMRKGRDLNTAG